MPTIKKSEEIELMRKAGRVVTETLAMLGEMVRAGVSTLELNDAADDFIRSCGAVPSFLHYNGYPKSICTSVNHEVVHGVPGDYRLCDGDIISIDVGAELNGWQGDAARTFLVGNVPDEVKRLVQVTKECFFEGMGQARAGNHVCDISMAVQAHAEKNGYSVVRELVGHGIGTKMHEEPEIPNYHEKFMGRGMKLAEGMTIALEPMINLGTNKVVMLDDGWTVTTADKKPSAHYENTIAITEGDPWILTGEA